MPQGKSQHAAQATQLVAVQGPESADDLLTVLGQRHPDRASIVRMRRPQNQALILRSVDQLYHAVVAQLETFGQFADQCPVPGRESLQRQQQLILLRSEPELAHGVLAEAQIAPEAEAE